VAASKKKKATGPFETLRALKEELRAKEDRAAPKKPHSPPKRASPERPDGTSPASPGRGQHVDDDALLFHRLFAGVKPLDRPPGRVPRQPVERSEAVQRAAKRGREAEQADGDAVHERLRALVEGGTRFEVADDGRRVEGRRIDLPIEALRRLRRGQLPIDGRLDLHGMAVSEARAQLGLFLRTMRTRGERCVLIIHGKGEHSPQGVGVLRGETAAWLSQGPSSQHVAAFATAAAHDGGEGALYVLLRR
jgi:DNA-nicking Smr family endonuclease